MHLRSSVQAQLPTERAPLSLQRCLVNQKACWAASAAGLFISGERAAWIRLLLRASNEHRFIVRVLRAREMNQAALPFPPEMKKPAGFHQQAFLKPGRGPNKACSCRRLFIALS